MLTFLGGFFWPAIHTWVTTPQDTCQCCSICPVVRTFGDRITPCIRWDDCCASPYRLGDLIRDDSPKAARMLVNETPHSVQVTIER
jgi:hypothetical protein